MKKNNITLNKIKSYLSDNERKLEEKESKFFKTNRYE